MSGTLPRRALPALLLPAAAAAQQGSHVDATTTRPAQAGAAASPPGLARAGERAVYRRAVEAAIWGMPAVNFELMAQAMRDAGAASNQIVYWSRPMSWKNQTLTPNPDTIYLMPFYDTKDVGPVVLEIPPADEGSITGSIDDGWQTALEVVGPAGAVAPLWELLESAWGPPRDVRPQQPLLTRLAVRAQPARDAARHRVGGDHRPGPRVRAGDRTDARRAPRPRPPRRRPHGGARGHAGVARVVRRG